MALHVREELPIELVDVPGRDVQGAAQGAHPMWARASRSHPPPMSRFLLQHHHEPHECGVVFTSFKGHHSPLRHQPTLTSCRSGGHEVWWTVDAASEQEALRLLPEYVAQRTTATPVSQVEIP